MQVLSLGQITVRFVAMAALTALVGGCASGGNAGSTAAMVGGFAPAQASTTPRAIAAAMGEGLLRGGAGTQLGDRDRRLALEAEYRALEYGRVGEAVAWQGDTSAVSGQVTALQPYRVGSQDCRQYSHTVRVSGQSQTAQGTACRNEDGSWTPLI